MRILLILLSAFALLQSQANAQCSLSVPTGLKGNNLTNCSVSLSWNSVSGAGYYRLEYRVTGDTSWMLSPPLAATAYTAGDLRSNTLYEFAVASYCADSTTAGYSSAITKSTKICTTPANLSTPSVASNSALLKWTQVCNVGQFTVQYKTASSTKWTTVSNIFADSLLLTGLTSGTSYNWKVKATCGSAKSSYSSASTFSTTVTTAPRRNILFIVLDDARYDISTLTSAPEWFETPNINRIAAEGVNFQIAIPATSQCSPSRATYYTGLYPHNNGVTKNGAKLSNTYPLVQQILTDNGYHTGFVGKFGQYLGQPRGFDWWATSDGDIYEDATYHINGNDTVIAGHILDVYPQLAKTFLNSVPQESPFALFYFTRAPHDPAIPRPEDADLYTQQALPFPSNFEFFETNYPSFYNNFRWNAADTAAVVDLKRRTYQTIKATDDNLDTIFAWLESRQLIDSTLIIFTSDNGMLMGEHHMDGKVLALEESIRVPLFLRYPGWFNQGTIIADEIASNIDIAITLLDFAGLPNTYGFQGLSLRDLANRTAHRKSFLYEYPGDPLNGAFRSVRTLEGKYIKSYCTEVTEEFYDLAADPQENINQIFNPDYADEIAVYRLLLDSLRNVLGDNASIPSKECHLITEAGRMVLNDDERELTNQVQIRPSPASRSFVAYFQNLEEEPALIRVFDYLHREVYRSATTANAWLGEIACDSWANGIYFVVVDQEGTTFTEKVVIRH